MHHANSMKFGIPPSVPADVSLHTISLEDCAASVILKLKFMIRKINVAIVSKATKRLVDKAAMEFAHLFAPLMKTISKEDVFASQATILSITSVLNVLLANSMMFIKESAESNVEPIKSTTSTQENVTALKDSILSKVFVLNVNLEKYMMNTKENVSTPYVKV